MGKHAYIIVAQGNVEILEHLLIMIDDRRNDIYLHINDKVSTITPAHFDGLIKFSHMHIYKKFTTCPGHSSMVEAQMFLLHEATKQTTYQYYHLLTDSDLPIKNQNYIHHFFDAHFGKEFIHFNDNFLNSSANIKQRYSLYHFFQKQRMFHKNDKKRLFYSFMAKGLLCIQKMFGTDRTKKNLYTIKCGANHASITHNLASFLCTNAKDIKRFCSHTKCPENFYLQTFVFNSLFIKKLYKSNQDTSFLMNMCETKNWKYPECFDSYENFWHKSDFELLMLNPCIFATNFSENDMDVVHNIFASIITRQRHPLIKSGT